MGAVARDRAVMASRVEAAQSLDYFPSPPWWGRAIGEVIARLGLPLGQVVEEPAAGEGHLAHGLADAWPIVRASDVAPYPRRAGLNPKVGEIGLRDYLAGDEDPWTGPDAFRPDWTVTNPPFGDRTAPFIRRAMGRSRIGAVMVLQLRLLEGPGRHGLFRECGLYATAVLPRRGSGLRKGVWVPKQSTATAYGLFVFVQPGVVPGWTGFAGEARQLWIAPDACDRLSREGDGAFAGLGGGAGSAAGSGRRGAAAIDAGAARAGIDDGALPLTGVDERVLTFTRVAAADACAGAQGLVTGAAAGVDAAAGAAAGIHARIAAADARAKSKGTNTRVLGQSFEHLLRAEHGQHERHHEDDADSVEIVHLKGDRQPQTADAQRDQQGPPRPAHASRDERGRQAQHHHHGERGRAPGPIEPQSLVGQPNDQSNAEDHQKGHEQQQGQGDISHGNGAGAVKGAHPGIKVGNDIGQTLQNGGATGPGNDKARSPYGHLKPHGDGVVPAAHQHLPVVRGDDTTPFCEREVGAAHA